MMTKATNIEDLPIPIHETFVLFDELVKSKNKTIALYEDKVKLLEERVGLLEVILDHLEISYDK